MDREKQFNNILDECLERVMKGEDIKACLARYPEYAVELEPLLKTALDTRAAAAIKPRPEFRQRAAHEFQAAIRGMPSKAPRGSFRWRAAWMTPLAVFLALVIAGSGTVAAASNSLPDSPLYQVKLAAESVQLAFTPSDLGKAELYSRFTDKRVEEIVRMAEKGKAGQIEKIADRMNDHLVAMANLTGGWEGGIETFTLTAQSPEMATQPTVADGTPPSELQTPAPTTVLPPSPTAVPGQAGQKGRGGQEETSPGKARNGNDTSYQPGKQERLRALLSEKEEKTMRILQDAWENAPESLKPALQRAIEIILNGYGMTISNLSN